MPDTETLTLPLLPLTTGVVLPQMVVTLAIESAEARDAAEGALAAGRRRAPARPPGRNRFARPSARSPGSRTSGDLPGGRPRARAAGPVAGASSARPCRATQPGVWVSRAGGRRAGESDRPGPRARPRVPGRRPGHRREARLARASPTRSKASTTSARSPTPRAGRPTCRSSARSSCWRRSIPRRASRRRSTWAREALAELDVSDQIRWRVTDDMDKTQREFLLRQQLAAIRKELGDDR